MRLEVTAYSLDGERLQTLTQARNISVSADGALSLDLPRGAPGIEYFENDVALAVEIPDLAGNIYGPVHYGPYGEFSSRYIYTASDQSLTSPLGISTFTAASIANAWFSSMRIVPPAIAADVVEYPEDATPFSVISNRIAEAQSRGFGTGITVIDGGGWAPATIASKIKFEPFAGLDAFYMAVKDGRHAELVWIGMTLYVLTPGTMSLDRSQFVRFQVKNFADVPVKIDRTNMADSVIALGDNDLVAQWPEVLVGKIKIVQASGVSKAEVLDTIVKFEWETSQKPLREITASLALSDDSPLVPFRDYRVGTIVAFPANGGRFENIPIAQITLTRKLGEAFSGSIILDTKIESLQVRMIQSTKVATAGVSAVSGTGALR